MSEIMVNNTIQSFFDAEAEEIMSLDLKEANANADANENGESNGGSDGKVSEIVSDVMTGDTGMPNISKLSLQDDEVSCIRYILCIPKSS